MRIDIANLMNQVLACRWNAGDDKIVSEITKAKSAVQTRFGQDCDLSIEVTPQMEEFIRQLKAQVILTKKS